MSKPKRYSFNINSPHLFEEDNGKYIEYSYFEALEQRLTKAASNKDFPNLTIEGALESLVKQRKEIEALEQENKDLLNACEMKQEIIDSNKTLAGDLVKAEQENERLKTVLEFYADEDNYFEYLNAHQVDGDSKRHYFCGGYGSADDVQIDKGKRAREWLKEKD